MRSIFCILVVSTNPFPEVGDVCVFLMVTIDGIAKRRVFSPLRVISSDILYIGTITNLSRDWL